MKTRCIAVLVEAFVCTWLLAPPLHAQRGASVAPANLEYLTSRAQTIVLGNVASTTFEAHPQFPNLETEVVTVTVAKTLKGPALHTLTFRQFVWNSGEHFKGGSYLKAQEILLFLNPVSEYGLTSPVGMDQGLFRVLHDDKGKRYVLNGRANVGLFSEVLGKTTANGVKLSARAQTMLGQRAGKAPLETFEEVVEALVGGQR